MSNVTPQEIIRLTATAFRQSFSATVMPGFTGVGYKQAKPWIKSRNVALLLIQRHTNLDWREIARIFDIGVHSAGSQVIRKIAERTEAEALLYPNLAVRLEQIESQIDVLHEQRCDPDPPPKRIAVVNAWLHGSHAETLNQMLAKPDAGVTHAH
jgi:hypothetical protein